MNPICSETQEWISESLTRPIDSFITEAFNSCQSAPTPINWICALVVMVIRVVLWVVELVLRLVAVVICVVAVVLDLIAAIVHLILSLPLIGGVLRTVMNYTVEATWRMVSLPDFFLSLAGVKVPKRMFLKLIILNENGTPLTSETSVMPQIQAAQQILQRECNVTLVYTGVCVPQINSPAEALGMSCDADGFFSDWSVGGAYYELVSTDCTFDNGFRRVSGFGAVLIAFVIREVAGTTIGCSFGPTHDYVVLENAGVAIDPNLLAHELVHACGVPGHVGDISNLMFEDSSRTGTTLNALQQAVVRTSRHCVLF